MSSHETLEEFGFPSNKYHCSPRTPICKTSNFKSCISNLEDGLAVEILHVNLQSRNYLLYHLVLREFISLLTNLNTGKIQMLKMVMDFFLGHKRTAQASYNMNPYKGSLSELIKRCLIQIISAHNLCLNDTVNWTSYNLVYKRIKDI